MAERQVRLFGRSWRQIAPHVSELDPERLDRYEPNGGRTHLSREESAEILEAPGTRQAISIFGPGAEFHVMTPADPTAPRYDVDVTTEDAEDRSSGRALVYGKLRREIAAREPESDKPVDVIVS